MKPFDRPVHWGTYLSVLLWNTSGYDSVGALAAEVRSPGRDFPRAMVATILLVTIVYVLPLVVAISLDRSDASSASRRQTVTSFTKVLSSPRPRFPSCGTVIYRMCRNAYCLRCILYRVDHTLSPPYYP